MPQNGDDLTSGKHECLNLRFPGATEFQWPLSTPAGPKRFRVSGRYESDDGDVLTDWALAGHGVALKPVFEIEDHLRRTVSLIPALSKVRLLRQWGGVVDQTMDGSPFIDETHIEGLYFNGGWCYGGFKATPASGYCYAHLLAKDEPHVTATAYRLDRFRRGAPIDEKGQGAQPNLH